MTTPQNW